MRHTNVHWLVSFFKAVGLGQSYILLLKVSKSSNFLLISYASKHNLKSAFHRKHKIGQCICNKWLLLEKAGFDSMQTLEIVT